MTSSRKSSYKLPPTTITDKLISQQARRAKILEEQKRRRADKIESSRHLENFAHLSLGADDDSGEEIVREGVGSFASMLEDSESKSSSGQGRKKSHLPVNHWADKCMYAELLEMSEDDPWSSTRGIDGLPEDLETGWVAVAPVPVGKRCIAICYQSIGVVGQVPNTVLRSRVLGKPLMARFPSALPSNTVLDCILDSNWRDNGILHILDVIKWKGQDVADCETPFRFWWRDTRLSELAQFYPPHKSSTESNQHRFSYPTTLLPIPYHTDTSYANLASHVIPVARTSRMVNVQVPADIDVEFAEDGMDMQGDRAQQLTVNVEPDGLLLYVSEASYESGTSPLSSWIPITAVQTEQVSPLDLFLRLVQKRMNSKQKLDLPSVPEIDMEA